jgi:hypothetical protein
MVQGGAIWMELLAWGVSFFGGASPCDGARGQNQKKNKK